MKQGSTTSEQVADKGVYVEVLGIAQDAGVPHVGCRCARCLDAQGDPSKVEYAAAVAIVDARQRPESVWLIDATPDIKFQLNFLASMLGAHPKMPDRLRQPEGLFLTHAHIGHTVGLAQLGPEGMNVRDLTVYASAGLVRILRETNLWRPLLDKLDLIAMVPDLPVELAPGLSVSPLAVPHRDELDAGTFAFQVQGPDRSLLYVPDIDDWEQWPRARQVISGADVTLADATFYSAGELAGRPPVAHPLVPKTVAFFAGLSSQLMLTHLNHTNPLLEGDSPLRAALATEGVFVAHFGQIISL